MPSSCNAGDSNLRPRTMTQIVSNQCSPLDQGSISSTFLLTTFTPADPESAKSRFWDRSVGMKAAQK